MNAPEPDRTFTPASAAPPAPERADGHHPLVLPCGTQLWLLPQRAVWWPAAGAVFVADVHFGKAATFRRAGQPVPRGTTADNLARLDDVLAATGARHLVFLGDFLHAASGADAALWQQLAPWRARHAADLDDPGPPGLTGAVALSSRARPRRGRTPPQLASHLVPCFVNVPAAAVASVMNSPAAIPAQNV